LIIILMIITAIYQVSRSPKSFPPLFKNSVFYSVAVLSLILVYLIGFGGRVLGNDTPKYLNSPETDIFHKGRQLYGLYEAQQYSA
ncbi:hypothetical protein MJL79_30045, partial [Salmonella enterica subsp. enterica serovar Montevideo]|nr:hypothetical protein [Salmonella enterica subsp. enterica serovar Montevideo]